MREFWSILKSLVIFCIFLGILIGIGFIYRHYEKRYPSTRDATLQADIIPVSTNIAGRVAQVYVKNNTLLKNHQLLFTLIDTKEKVAYQKALADLRKNTATYQRYTKVSELSAGSVSKEQLELVRTAMQVSQANVATEKYNLDSTKIYAPSAGIINNFYLEPGRYLAPSDIVGALIIEHSAYVRANILEPFLENIRIGQQATFQFRMYPGRTFKGIVESIGYGIATRADLNTTLPYVDPEFNWVYLAKRFPVRIKVTSKDPFHTTPFRVGASVNVSIDADHHAQN